MRAGRWLLVGVVYVSLIVGGMLVANWLTEWLDMDIRPSNEPRIHAMLMLATSIYVVASALPFVPGAEIGAGLMVVFGKPIVFLVYIAMVAAILIAFLAGRLVPVSVLGIVLEFLGLQRARTLVERMDELPFEERLAFLIARAPARFVPLLLRHRYLAIALAFNLPGNTLMGGGGGIALLAGMSGLFTSVRFAFAVVVAVSPIPLFVVLTGYQPMV